ncbi:negative transcriptional regulator, PaiB family [Loktanella fryxellensis]|uniref:Negative transcriptional regulator, PaiB family n=1 Tax=Loktanella fryxellensis TaxID=245187 RepID=A0A1H8AUP6_9RHOB|nr:FMN-binding negative transcriptional regulator [Loktanella fryxellensis]SEM74440.1 negative transcriptional regulator, PaiB family [Loktanella fryxellensis]
MYAPPAFREDRVDVLRAAVGQIMLAALVTQTADGPVATHVPMLLTGPDDALVLETHVARANPHWRTPGPSIAIFQGPQAYVSPSFYPSKAETGKVVPTWTYISVHAHGSLRVVDDPDWLHAHVTTISDRMEADRPAPWAVSDAPADYIAGLQRGIVGLRLTVDRLEGAWKVNQHKPQADRDGTARGLAASGPQGAALARVLRPEV